MDDLYDACTEQTRALEACRSVRTLINEMRELVKKCEKRGQDSSDINEYIDRLLDLEAETISEI